MLNSSSSLGTKFREMWYFDSGATHHITNCFSDLVNPRECSPKVFTVANSSELVCNYQGTVVMGRINFIDVYFNPDLPCKLVSESRMMKQGCSVVKCPKAMTVQVLHEKLGVLLEGSLHGGLFGLNSYLGDKGLEPAYQIREFDHLASDKAFIDSQKKIIEHMSLKECVLGVALSSSPNLSLSGYDNDDYTDYDESDLDYSDSEDDELPDLDDFDSESDSEEEESSQVDKSGILVHNVKIPVQLTEAMLMHAHQSFPLDGNVL